MRRILSRLWLSVVLANMACSKGQAKNAQKRRHFHFSHGPSPLLTAQLDPTPCKGSTSDRLLVSFDPKATENRLKTDPFQDLDRVSTFKKREGLWLKMC